MTLGFKWKCSITLPQEGRLGHESIVLILPQECWAQTGAGCAARPLRCLHTTYRRSPHMRIPRHCSLVPMPWQLSSWGRTARGGLHHLVSEAACQKLTHQHGWSDSRHLLGNATPPRNQEQGIRTRNKAPKTRPPWQTRD